MYLRELIASVEGATGPDGTIDWLVYTTIVDPSAQAVKPNQRYLYGEQYTGDLNAVVELVRREMPDLAIDISIYTPGVADASLWRSGMLGAEIVGEAEREPTPALALLLAFLRAKSAALLSSPHDMPKDIKSDVGTNTPTAKTSDGGT